MQYYLDHNPRSAGPRRVHAETCPDLPHPSELFSLGELVNPSVAVARAQRMFRRSAACERCIGVHSATGHQPGTAPAGGAGSDFDMDRGMAPARSRDDQAEGFGFGYDAS